MGVRAWPVMSDSLRPHGLYIAHQAPLSMDFSRQEYWIRLPFPALGDLPDPGIAPASLASPALAGGFLTSSTTVKYGLPGSDSGKEPTCQGRRHKTCRFYPWVGKIPWSRKWQPTPVFLPGEFHGQRSLVGYIQSMGLQRVGHD